MRNPFVGIPSFLMAPLCFDLDQLKADIAVIGMPLRSGDLGQYQAPGSAWGVREASSYNCYAHEGWYDPIRKETFWASRGKLSTAATWMSCIPSRPAAFKTARRPFGKSFPKSNPLCHWRRSRYYHADPARFDCFDNLCVIHFDAHLDFNKNPHGIAEGPGSPMRRASEMAPYQ